MKGSHTNYYGPDRSFQGPQVEVLEIVCPLYLIFNPFMDKALTNKHHVHKYSNKIKSHISSLFFLLIIVTKSNPTFSACFLKLFIVTKSNSTFPACFLKLFIVTKSNPTFPAFFYFIIHCRYNNYPMYRIVYLYM